MVVSFYSGKLSSVLFREIIKRFFQGNYQTFYSGKLSNVLFREIIKRFIQGNYLTFFSEKFSNFFSDMVKFEFSKLKYFFKLLLHKKK
jgi:hypothetical protein